MDKENEASAGNQVGGERSVCCLQSRKQPGAYQAEDEETLPDELKLKVTAGPSNGTDFYKPGVHKLTVGRTRASKVWIRDSAVSEKHAEVFWDGKCWALQDKGSSNGTLLNGISLEAEGESSSLLCAMLLHHLHYQLTQARKLCQAQHPH